jgi:general stress protein 26
MLNTEKLNFNELKAEIIKILNNTCDMVLATSYKDKVMARTMNIVNDELKLFCQTDKFFFKSDQIVNNPFVALCINNLQIEGSAKITGHPVLEENRKFSELFKQKHPAAFEKYSKLVTETVIEIQPTIITLWKQIDSKPCREFLDINNNEAIREFYVK